MAYLFKITIDPLEKIMRQALSIILCMVIFIMPITIFAGDCADVNSSGGVNLLDVTYLINYLYKGGPEPDCGETTGTVTDVDGNTYLTVKIGAQWWMAENLKVTHYSNGDPILNIIDPEEWKTISIGAYCVQNNDTANIPIYGYLYNWYNIIDSRGVAPVGWHVPSDTEWKQLEIYLGMNPDEADSTGWRGSNEGGKLKDTGTIYWISPNTGATNETGFSGLPGGSRNWLGEFSGIGGGARFWSSTERLSSDAWYRDLAYLRSEIGRSWYDQKSGLSIRCVKD